ncbi:MAG TPA: terminase small subunit [Chitinophagaceae bacterium]|nr:terminase small subunit [Chitinophagaceae bacterium]
MPYRLQPADVQAKFEEYRRQCDENIETVRYRDKLVQVPKKIIYSLEGFCLFLDMGDEELKKYEDNKNYRAIFKKIRYLVMCRKMQALVNGEGNTRGLVFDLKVNHGIDPKQAREEQDWKVTLNLNHDSGRVLEEGKPAIVQEGKPGSQGDGQYQKQQGPEPGSPENGKPGAQENGMPASLGEREGERKDSGLINSDGSISLNKRPVSATAGPPKPEKMNPYSVW